MARAFGWGSNKKLRHLCYVRIAWACATPGQRGELAVRITSEAMVEARNKREPGRWFCRAVIARLEEAQILTPASAEDIAAFKQVADVLSTLGIHNLS
jgi:hypothetical protein